MPRKTFRRFFVPIVLAVVASPCTAYLVENHEFDNDISGWTVESGNWSHQAGDGLFGLGSAEVSSVVGDNSLSQCTSVASVGPGKSLYLIAFARTVNHTSPVQLSLELFSSADCGGSAVDTHTYQLNVPPLDQWSPTIHVVTSVPAGGAASARVWLTAQAGSEGEITRFDFAAMTDNLAPNPAFTDDISGWVINNGTWAHTSGDGYGTPAGAAAATVESGSAFISQCLLLDSIPRAEFYFGGGVFKALDVVEDYGMLFRFFSSFDCSGPTLSESFLLVDIQQLNSWEFFSTAFASPDGANSVASFIGTVAGPATEGSRFLVDSVFLAPPANLYIFDDGFESGDTSAWSNTVP